MKRSLFLMFVLAACGDNGGSGTDAGGDVDASGSGSDSGIDSPPQADCAYSEMRDVDNDTTEDGTAEATNVTLSSRTVLCGKVEHTHFIPDITVDGDAYHVTAPVEMDVVVRITGDLTGIELAGVDVYPGPSFQTLAGGNVYYGDHGVGIAHLPAGPSEILVLALNTQAITATRDYRIEITEDQPALRCPEVTTGGYTEANDGNANTGNDVFTFPQAGTIALTASTTDAAEAAGAMPARIAGSIADTTVDAQYKDRDAYTFTTGATTNEITIRLTWPVTPAANLDFMLFEGTSVMPETRVVKNNTSGTELLVYSIKPNTTYTLLVAGKSATTFPVAYNATLCGGTFVP